MGSGPVRRCHAQTASRVSSTRARRPQKAARTPGARHAAQQRGAPPAPVHRLAGQQHVGLHGRGWRRCRVGESIEFADRSGGAVWTHGSPRRSHAGAGRDAASRLQAGRKRGRRRAPPAARRTLYAAAGWWNCTSAARAAS